MSYKLNKAVSSVFLESYPTIKQWYIEAYGMLERGNFTKKNPFTYNDEDSEAWVLKTNNPNIKALVLGDRWFSHGGFKIAICLNSTDFITEFTAHRTSGRTTSTPYGIDKFTAEYLAKKDFNWRDIKGIYGDVRDTGFMFKAEEIPLDNSGNTSVRLDSPAYYVREIEKVFFDINNLNAALEDGWNHAET